MRIAILLVAPLLLSGCIAKTAVDIVTLPVKAVGAGVDAVTTSQSEADEKRGREGCAGKKYSCPHGATRSIEIRRVSPVRAM